MFEKLFRLSAYQTNIRTEVLAGITTFLTMSYIIIVNPGILAAAGIPRGPSTVATIIAAVVGTLIMAFYANRPIAIAPYMGENAFIAFTVVLSMKHSWQAGITAVLIGGVLFMAITLFGLRAWLAKAVPTSLKFAFVVGIGLFLTFIGLVDTGIVTPPSDIGILGIPDMPAEVKVDIMSGIFLGDFPPPPVQVGNLMQPEVLLAIFAFVLMGICMIKGIRGGIMIGILTTTVLAFLGKSMGWNLPNVHMPDSLFSMPPSIGEIAFQFNFAEVLTIGFLPVLLTVFLMDFVDTMGTLIGVSARAGFLDEDGNLPDIEKPMLADAVATIVGACCGTTTTGSYIESAAGIEEGGRTGLTALTTAAFFGLALFFTPIFTAIPKCAYGPALIIVGVLMIDSIRKIDFSDLTELIPAFCTIILMSFTYNLGIGITAGFVMYPVMKLLSGRGKEISAGAWILGAISLIFYIFYPYH